MLLFIVPLKSKDVSKSWEAINRLLDQTIRSLTKQTSQDFKVIIVCNEMPLRDYGVNVLQIDKIELKIDNGVQNTFNGDADKINKIIAGFNFGMKYNPSYVMVVDADDLVSNQVVEYTTTNTANAGWLLESGYIYEKELDEFYIVHNSFYQSCGTGLILTVDSMGLLLNTNPMWFDHQLKSLKTTDISFDALPFAGVIYNSMNGENLFSRKPVYSRQLFTQKYNASKFDFVEITAGIKAEFSLSKIEHPTCNMIL